MKIAKSKIEVRCCFLTFPRPARNKTEGKFIIHSLINILLENLCFIFASKQHLIEKKNLITSHKTYLKITYVSKLVSNVQIKNLNFKLLVLRL